MNTPRISYYRLPGAIGRHDNRKSLTILIKRIYHPAWPVAKNRYRPATPATYERLCAPEVKTPQVVDRSGVAAGNAPGKALCSPLSAAETLSGEKAPLGLRITTCAPGGRKIY